MFNTWLQNLLEQPRVFCRWFKYPPFPKDLHRSFNFIFELIMGAPIKLELHPDYLEVFSAVDEWKHVLRVSRASLAPEERAGLDWLEKNWKVAFKVPRPIPSGNKTLYTHFKQPVELDRLHLLITISSHLLSCLPTLPTLKLLCGAARSASAWTLCSQLSSDKLYAKLMSHDTLRCPECGLINVRQQNSGRWAECFNENLYAFADEIATTFPQYTSTTSNYLYTIHHWKQYLLNALTTFYHPDRPKEVQDIVDRFVLGFPSSSSFKMPPAAEQTSFFIAPQSDVNSRYGFDVPDSEIPEGDFVWSDSPLQIYPMGQYGGASCVVLDPADRSWQFSFIVKCCAMTRHRKAQKYVPLTAALWSMINHGDLAMLTEILQHWDTRRTHHKHHSVPERCKDREVWKRLRDIFEVVGRTYGRTVVRLVFAIIKNFITDEPLYLGKDLATNETWIEALRISDWKAMALMGPKPCDNPLFIEPTHKPAKMKSGKKSEPVFYAPGDHLSYGYDLRGASSHVHPLWRYFFVAEAERRGVTEAEAYKHIPQPPSISVMDSAWVMFSEDGQPEKPTPLSDLTVFVNEPQNYPVPAVVPRPRFSVCKGHSSQPLLNPPPPPERYSDEIARRREEARRLREANNTRPVNDSAGIHFRKMYEQLLRLKSFLDEVGIEGVVPGFDNTATDGQGRVYRIKGNHFEVEGLGEFYFNEKGVREFAQKIAAV